MYGLHYCTDSIKTNCIVVFIGFSNSIYCIQSEGCLKTLLQKKCFNFSSLKIIHQVGIKVPS